MFPYRVVDFAGLSAYFGELSGCSKELMFDSLTVGELTVGACCAIKGLRVQATDVVL